MARAGKAERPLASHLPDPLLAGNFAKRPAPHPDPTGQHGHPAPSLALASAWLTGEPFYFWGFVCGGLLARARCRNGDAAKIAGYCGLLFTPPEKPRILSAWLAINASSNLPSSVNQTRTAFRVRKTFSALQPQLPTGLPHPPASRSHSPEKKTAAAARSSSAAPTPATASTSPASIQDAKNRPRNCLLHPALVRFRRL